MEDQSEPFPAGNLHLISGDALWLLKHFCLLQFILHCNKRLRIFNAKLRLRADKPDMTVKWAFPEPRQPCGDLNKTKQRPWNKQDNYGLGCRVPVCLPVAFIPQTLNRNKSPLVAERHLQATPPSAERQILRPWQMKMNLLFLHSLEKVRQQRIVSYVTGCKPSSKLKAGEEEEASLLC